MKESMDTWQFEHLSYQIRQLKAQVAAIAKLHGGRLLVSKVVDGFDTEYTLYAEEPILVHPKETKEDK